MSQKSIFIKELDEKNRLPISKEILKRLGWEGTGVTVSLDIVDGGLLVRKISNNCVFCGENTDDFFKGKPICKKCREQLTYM